MPIHAVALSALGGLLPPTARSVSAAVVVIEEVDDAWSAGSHRADSRLSHERGTVRFHGRARSEQAPAHKRSLHLPSAGAAVRVQVGEHSVRCEVERVGDVDLDVVLPGGGWAVDDGSYVTVEWPNGHGLTSMRAQVETLGLASWRLVPLGGLEEHQRRAFVRVQAAVRVQLRLSGGVVLHAFTSDVSEGGLGVHLRDDVEPIPAPGDVLKIQLLLDAQAVKLPAEVVRVRELDEGKEVACRFVEPYPADVVRAWVVQTELRERARRRAQLA